MARTPRKRVHMTREEKEKWDELYEYVRSNVMGYDENICLSSNMVLRLKGMLNGKFMANNLIENKAYYSYDVVLMAFKYSMPKIRRVMDRVSFVDENHRFNYIMRIVDDNLSTVYLRMKNAEKIKKEVEKETATVDTYNAVEYKPVKKTVKKDKFANLW